MLLDDDKQFVELMMENVLWGNITFDWDKIDDDENKLPRMMGNFIRLHKKDSNSEDIKKLIKQLAREFRAQRVMGDSIIGELRDRDHEKKLEQAIQDNESLAQRLKDAYIPSTDTRIGTN